MFVYDLWNDNNGKSVFMETDCKKDLFGKELQSFLCNDFQNNEGLTVDLFAERLFEMGYQARVLRPTECFQWWGESQ